MEERLQEDYFNKLKYLFILLRARISNEDYEDDKLIDFARKNDFEGFIEHARNDGVSGAIEEQKLQGKLPLFFMGEIFTVSIFEAERLVHFIDNLPPPPEINSDIDNDASFISDEKLNEYLEKNKHLFEKDD